MEKNVHTMPVLPSSSGMGKARPLQEVGVNHTDDHHAGDLREAISVNMRQTMANVADDQDDDALAGHHRDDRTY
ncbi:hypothetical protein [Heliophilum fasciatum]|uniref:Uncharacterized protein n=1 Tax=Heliophilum fasciatum TaxID=35700 RepID=A0A4R2RH64_9FIRM|nr:hypothetical protein [Heliophilum fasciatum]MCW2278971.1 tRNA(Ile)-lysidine synthase TilS/MesJ [Heliophilum fasciatum]TCP61779.1 hypothetical protein EDD73_12510 [Heliophilum fasciatum]